MGVSKPLADRVTDTTDRLIAYFHPQQSDPTYLVLKAHLLAEELLFAFVRSQVAHPEHLDRARLTFSQLLLLAQSMHRFSAEDWWGWTALSRLNGLRNLLAHNLEPANLQDRVVEFTVFVGKSITAKNKELEGEYMRLANDGTHPFLLSLVALHTSVSTTLGFSPGDWSPTPKQAP